MKSFKITLSDEDFKIANEKFPKIKNSKVIEKRAEYLIKNYFYNNYDAATFSDPSDGSDLLVEYIEKDGSKVKIKMEIKGTSAENLNKSNIKVTGKRSFDLLKSGLPIYRVTGVFNQTSDVHIMIYGEDYNLLMENRWTAR